MTFDFQIQVTLCFFNHKKELINLRRIRIKNKKYAIKLTHYVKTFLFYVLLKRSVASLFSFAFGYLVNGMTHECHRIAMFCWYEMKLVAYSSIFMMEWNGMN